MPSYLVSNTAGWAEIEEAESPEKARRQFVVGCREVFLDNDEAQRFYASPITVKDLSKERSEYCVCGVHESEHLLCGCGEWERAN